MKDFFTVSPEDTPVIAIYTFFVVFALAAGIWGKMTSKKDKENQ